MAEDKDKQEKSKDSKKDETPKHEPAKEAPTKEKKGKDKEKEGKKEKGEFKISKKDLNLKPDFRYVVRIANTDIDGTRTIPLGLTTIDGIGIRVAAATVTSLGLSHSEMLGNLSEEQISALESGVQNVSKSLPPWMLNRPRDWELGSNRHVFGTELHLKERDDINMMKMIRCYKGIRHETGQKVRGQRTKSNGRTGLTMGVTKKMALAAAKASKEEEKRGSAKSAPAAKPAEKAKEPAK